MNKQQKKTVIRQLLMPVILIIAALLYQPVKGFLDPDPAMETITTDGSRLEVSYLDVGQGDATLITKGNFHMLIDAGKNEKGDMVVQYLKDAGVDKLDILVGTHPDSDHIGGLDCVIDAVAVDTLYMPDTEKDTKTYRDVKTSMKRKNLSAGMPEIGKEYTYDGNVLVRFLAPAKKYADANDNSLVVQLAYGKNRFLFMGDAEEEVEKDILAAGYDLECDVLKLGHHGSYTATRSAFLQKADPVYGVISCGKGNSYGHPHAETLAKLEDEDVQVYRTDRMGTVRAVSDGKNVTLSASKS